METTQNPIPGNNGSTTAATTVTAAKKTRQRRTAAGSDTVKTKATSQTGHVMNVANMQTMIAICESLGAVYAPGNADISLDNLRNSFKTDTDNLLVMNTQLANTSKARIERNNYFNQLNGLAAKAGLALESLGAGAKVIKQGRGYVRRLRGKRSAKPVELTSEQIAAGDIPLTNSSSQVGFDNRINTFESMVEFLKVEPKYKPKEAHLTIEGLQAFLKNLKDSNLAAKGSQSQEDAARQQRNVAQYDMDNSLLARSRMVKAYLKSILPANSEQFKKVRSLRFSANGRRKSK